MQENDELNFLYSNNCYLPGIISRTCQKLSLLLFALSQLAAGKGIHAKSIPRLNRLGKLRILIAKPRWKWMRRRHEKLLDGHVEYAVMMSELERNDKSGQ